jgi:hypothetical protein
MVLRNYKVPFARVGGLRETKETGRAGSLWIIRCGPVQTPFIVCEPGLVLFSLNQLRLVVVPAEPDSPSINHQFASVWLIKFSSP